MKNMEKTASELVKERSKRVLNAVPLKVPDRIPFIPQFTFFSARYGGITAAEAM